VKAFEILGFRITREREHISMERINKDGPKTPLTLPNQRLIKRPTFRKICTQSKISREEFINAYKKT
jgi:hypothetical protein